MVSKPQVITTEENGQLMEPMENIYIDLDEDHVGTITEKLSVRKGKMINLQNNGFGRVTLQFKIPSRGLIGFRSQFLTDTKGTGIMNTLFDSYAPWHGNIPQRTSGVLIADRPGKVTTYASLGMVDRGELYLEVGTEVYKGMILGKRNRPGDLDVNITREKKLTNMRASSSDATVVLRPPQNLSLDQSIEFIAEDELIEITPIKIRLRKMELDANKRISKAKKNKEWYLFILNYNIIMLKKVLLPILLIILFSCSEKHLFQFSEMSLDEILLSNKDKIIMIDFYSENWGSCLRLEVETLNTKEVIEFSNKHLIPIKVNAWDNGNGYKLFNSFNGVYIPLVLFLDHTGKEIDRVVGFKEKEEFLSILNNIINNTDTYMSLFDKYLINDNNPDIIDKLSYKSEIMFCKFNFTVVV